MIDKGSLNTNRELWREVPEDYYSPSVFVTENGRIGINVGGHCLVAGVREWHQAGQRTWYIAPDSSQWLVTPFEHLPWWHTLLVGTSGGLLLGIVIGLAIMAV